jgi:hypothetical protein
MCQFLELVVENSLSGGVPLKETAIGAQVFGRALDYDSSVEPIVRVEARRLRQKLQQYYEREGATDPVVIHLPKGGYMPEFEIRAAAIPAIPEPVATMAAMLTRESTPPRVSAPGIPSGLEWIILRCLRKDPAKRLQHMADVKAPFDGLKEESESAKLARLQRSNWRSPQAAAAVFLVVAGAAAFGFWSSRHQEAGQPPHVIPLTTSAGSENYPSFSPDGNQVVFSWNGEKKDNWDLYVKLISGANVLRLTVDAADNVFPAWSPRGGQIAFLKSAGCGHRRGVRENPIGPRPRR